MVSNELNDDLMIVLKVIGEKGAMTCAGACERKKVWELHCRDISKILNISPYTIRDRVQALINMGLIERNRAEREVGGFVTNFTLTSEGEEALAGQ
jgi:DNA-binding MarR family transcriptional regulator